MRTTLLVFLPGDGKVTSVKRRISLIVTAALAFSLSACSAVTDFFGPHPNEDLVALASQARDEGNTELADVLFNEVSRICGTRPDGTVPPTCEVDKNAPAAGPAPGFLDADVPEQTRPLMVSLAIDAAVAQMHNAPVQPPERPAVPKDLPLDEDALQAAKDLLSAEYELIWGLDLARSFAAPEQEDRIDFLLAQHEQTALELNTHIPKAPAPAAGYEPAGLEFPTDSASSEAFVNALVQATQERYAAAAAEAAAATTDKNAAAATPWLQWLVSTAAYYRAV